MIGIGFVAGVIVAVWAVLNSIVPDPAMLRPAVDVVGGVMLAVAFGVPLACWPSLQKIERKVFSRVSELLLHDWLLWLLWGLLVLFALASFIGGGSHFVVWIVCCGIAFDVAWVYQRRFFSYGSHPYLLDRLLQQCMRLVRHEQENEALALLETAVEVASKAASHGSIHLAKDALACLQSIVEHFVHVASRVSALRTAAEIETQPSLLDEVSVLSAYVCRRLEWLHGRALAEAMDPIADTVVATLANMSLFFAKYRIELAAHPLLFAERCAKAALEAGRVEVAVQAECTLSELMKRLIALSKKQNVSLQSVLLPLLLHLEEIVKAAYQRQKVDAVLLMQPFAEIGQMVGQPEYAAFADRETVLTELKRILQEFGMLDQMLRRMPPSTAPSPSAEGM